MVAVGACRSPGADVAAVGAWPVLWAPYGRRGGVAGPMGPEWPPFGRGWSPEPRMVAVGAWPFPWATNGCCGVWPVPWAPNGCRGGVAVPLGLVWWP